MSGEFLTTSEVAERLGVSTSWLRKWTDRGYLSPKKDGSRIMWSDSDVARARELKNGNSDRSPAEAIIERLGGRQFLAAFDAALEAFDRLQPGEVIIVSAKGSRRVRRDEPVGPHADALGNGIAVLLS